MITNAHTLEGRRQRRIERRRQEIMLAAARVFAQRGYAYATTRDIAEAADIAEGTLYNYFGGKREILLAIVDESQAAVEELLNDAGQLEKREDIVALIEKGLLLFVVRLPFTRTLLLESWVDDAILQDFVLERVRRIKDGVETFIVRHMKSGVFRPIAPDLTTRMVLGMILALLLPVLRGIELPPTPLECHTLAEAVVDVLLDGLRVRQES